nr:TRAP transporter small permease [uncultured Tistrella sp.]|tara:strand:+ start:241 stop:774 length:534 start_codon:yes stop_codon:yes gene_type:complete
MLHNVISAGHRVLGGIERGLLVVASIALILIAALILIEIVSRWLPVLRIPDNIIIVRQLMVVSIACSLGWVTGRDGHIAIDLLFQHMTPRQQRACRGLALVCGLVMAVPLVVWIAGDVGALYASQSFYFGELKLPEWPVRTAFLFGLLSLTARLCLQLASLMAGSDDPVPSDAGHKG